MKYRVSESLGTLMKKNMYKTINISVKLIFGCCCYKYLPRLNE